MKKFITILLVICQIFSACNSSKPNDKNTKFEEKKEDINNNSLYEDTSISENYKLKNIEEFTKEFSFYTNPANIRFFKLNDSAVRIIQKTKKESNKILKDSLLNQALKYLDLALQMDSNFYSLYLNKSTVLWKLGESEKSIKILQDLLRRKKHPEALFTLGLIYEKLGNKNLAEIKFKEAYMAYEEYNESPLATERDILNREYALLFWKGKVCVLKEINNKLKKDPDNPSLLIDKQTIENFDRKSFFNNY